MGCQQQETGEKDEERINEVLVVVDNKGRCAKREERGGEVGREAGREAGGREGKNMLCGR